MTKNKSTTQVLLKNGPNISTVSWISTQSAVLGGSYGKWTIAQVYSTRSAKETNERSRDYKNQRKASDI